MIDLFGGLLPYEKTLDFHAARHGVLASNIANVETPGYRPMDVSFDAHLRQAGEALTRTDPRHLAADGAGSFEMELFEDTSVAPGNDGNAVSMEREMAKLTANALRYKVNVEIVSRRLARLRYVVSDGKAR